ncbi:MAG: hypothetical protein QNK79_06725 [Synechococcus sp. ArSW.bin.68]
MFSKVKADWFIDNVAQLSKPLRGSGCANNEMPLAFHVCRHEATDVATANDGEGGHQDNNESTPFYNSLPINRESVDTVSMIREASSSDSSRIPSLHG